MSYNALSMFLFRNVKNRFKHTSLKFSKCFVPVSRAYKCSPGSQTVSASKFVTYKISFHQAPASLYSLDICYLSTLTSNHLTLLPNSIIMLEVRGFERK